MFPGPFHIFERDPLGQAEPAGVDGEAHVAAAGALGKNNCNRLLPIKNDSMFISFYFDCVPETIHKFAFVYLNREFFFFCSFNVFFFSSRISKTNFLTEKKSII